MLLSLLRWIGGDSIMRESNKHVIHNSDGSWGVKTVGSSKHSKNFSTQRDVINWGTEAAKKSKSQLFIHSREGRIRERNSCGNDPYPPKG